VTWQLVSIIPVWILGVVGAVIIGLSAPHNQYLIWLPIALAGCTIAAFAIQLAIQRKEGFVFRMMSSVSGAVIVLGVATAVLASIE
jgi:hypothetical protein